MHKSQRNADRRHIAHTRYIPGASLIGAMVLDGLRECVGDVAEFGSRTAEDPGEGDVARSRDEWRGCIMAACLKWPSDVPQGVRWGCNSFG